MSGLGVEEHGDITDEQLLREFGLDPDKYEIVHCSHCDRSTRHPSCQIVEREQMTAFGETP